MTSTRAPPLSPLPSTDPGRSWASVAAGVGVSPVASASGASVSAAESAATALGSPIRKPKTAETSFADFTDRRKREGPPLLESEPIQPLSRPRIVDPSEPPQQGALRVAGEERDSSPESAPATRPPLTLSPLDSTPLQSPETTRTSKRASPAAGMTRTDTLMLDGLEEFNGDANAATAAAITAAAAAVASHSPRSDGGHSGSSSLDPKIRALALAEGRGGPATSPRTFAKTRQDSSRSVRTEPSPTPRRLGATSRRVGIDDGTGGRDDELQDAESTPPTAAGDQNHAIAAVAEDDGLLMLDMELGSEHEAELDALERLQTGPHDSRALIHVKSAARAILTTTRVLAEARLAVAAERATILAALERHRALSPRDDDAADVAAARNNDDGLRRGGAAALE